MPLFKRKPFPLAEPLEDIKPDELVFQVRFTKEIFRDYQEYLKRINLYRQRVWMCKVTGKTNLTYEEALVSERRATEKVQQFPKELMGPVLHLVQFNTLRFKELVSTISKSIKDRFLVGEEVIGKQGDSPHRCKILKVFQQNNDGADSFQYEVGWLDKNKKVTGTCVVAAETLVRKKQLITSELLKSFIRESTSCNAPCWVVHDTLAQKYKIPTDPPKDLKDKLIKLEQQDDHRSEGNKRSSVQNIENGNTSNRKHKRKEPEKMEEGTEAKKEKVRGPEKLEEGTETKKRKDRGPEKLEEGTKTKKKKDKGPEKSEEETESKKKKEKVQVQPKVEPIKYPIEDLLVQPGPDDPVFKERPVPSTDFLVPMDCVGDLLMVWDFCTSFGKALHLWSFSLDDFEKAIDYREGEVMLLAEAHYAILRIVLKDCNGYQELVQKKRKPKVSIQNWKDHLCDFLEVEEVVKLFSHLQTIRCGNYRELVPRAKLDILRELVDRALTSDVIRGQLDEYIEEQQALAATKREEEMEEARRKKELQQQLKQAIDEAKEDLHVNKEQENGVNDRTMELLESDVPKCYLGQNGNALGGVAKEITKSNGTEDVLDNANENGDVKPPHTTSRQAALKQKLDAKATEEREKEMARIEEQKKIQEKRKVKAEITKEQKLEEQRALEMQKRKEHFERELEKRFVRTNSLGRDRNYNRYWFFRREGRIFVESEDCSRWGYYSAKEEVDALMGSLNPKGVRERALQRQMEKHHLKISNAMQRRSKEIAQKFAMEEAALRRSTRVRTQPKAVGMGFISYVNKHRV